jgi:RimJ/RimL family protein N-acetyltransferase
LSDSHPRLTYRTLDDVGEAAFLNAIERVSTDSFDQISRDERDRLGPKGEALQTLDELRSMTYEPPWWELGFDAEGELVGLIMPTGAPSFVTIGYIGVVPEQRGHGYVNELLARGTVTLLRIGRGMDIRADTDVTNAPMAAAFERAGYSRFATRREYELRL